MKRVFLALAAVALLVMTADTASARPRWGVSLGYGGGYYGSPYGWGGSGFGISYGTRIGDDGFLRVGYSSGPRWGYSYPYYSTPYYYSTPVYTTPYYYSSPVYSTGYYYSRPSYGFSYYRGGWGW
jgi:hypothetical protein